MKKILVIFALFAALIFVTSCGSGSKNENKGDNADTGDTATDNDTGDSGSTGNPDSDNPDTAPDAGDSVPDNGDSTPDNDADSGDSAPDSDNEEPINENPDNLPECSPTSATPCIDSETGLIWSGKAPERIRWIDAVDHCKNLKEGGYNDWKLPTIAALETLVKQCESNGYSDGECSKLGDIVFFWSGTNTGTEASGVFFYNGATQTKNVDETFDARCVRRDRETRNVNCTGIPEQHARWNSVSEITQTWDWSKASWIPASNIAYYEEESSTTECRFKCDKNYFFDSCSGCIDHYTGLTDDCAQCPSENILATPEELTNHSQEEIQSAINYYHDQNRSQCHGSFTEKEIYDAKGNLCIEDECNIEPNDIAQEAGTVWIDNLPFLVGELFSGGLSQMGDIVYYRKIEQLNKGNPTDLTITRKFMTFYIKDVPTTSCFQPNNIVEDASTITMVPTTVGDRGCYADEQSILPDDTISTKNIQPKITSSEFKKACTKVPNSQFIVDAKKCSTTITEFAWLENVVQYLNSKNDLDWNSTRIINTKIEKDVNNNVFRMYFSVDGGQYSWVVELPDAKRCLDECYGIDGCEVSIKPSPDISNGCVVQEP